MSWDQVIHDDDDDGEDRSGGGVDEAASAGASAIEALLAGGAPCTLEDVLDEQEVLQECKAHNPELLRFLCRKEIMQQVLQYVVMQAPADRKGITKETAHYPIVCAELVCSDVAEISECICASEDLLGVMFSFLYRDPVVLVEPAKELKSGVATLEAELASLAKEVAETGPMPVLPVPVLLETPAQEQTATFADAFPDLSLADLAAILFTNCTRVAQYLMQRKVAEVMDFLHKKEDFVAQLFKHISKCQQGALELLIQIFQCSEHPDGSGTLEWLCQSSMVSHLVNLFASEYSDEVHEGAAQAMCEVIATSFMSSSVPSPIVDNIQQEEVATRLLTHFFADDSEWSAMKSGLSALILLLSYMARNDYDSTSTLEVLPGIYAASLATLPRFHDILNHTDERTTLSYSDGKSVVPLGIHRLRIVEFVYALLRANAKCVLDHFATSPILPRIVDMMFHFSWNTLLHQVVQDILDFLFASPHTELKLYVLTSTRLLQRILDTEAASAQEQSDTGLARGNIGTLTKIANTVNLLVTKNGPYVPDPRLVELVAGVPGWEEYTNTTLAKRLHEESQLLGGKRPGMLSPSQLDLLLNDNGGGSGGNGMIMPQSFDQSSYADQADYTGSLDSLISADDASNPWNSSSSSDDEEGSGSGSSSGTGSGGEEGGIEDGSGSSTDSDSDDVYEDVVEMSTQQAQELVTEGPFFQQLCLTADAAVSTHDANIATTPPTVEAAAPAPQDTTTTVEMEADKMGKDFDDDVLVMV
eukprot:TRINITY_DN3619_c0_g1_i1.p1 TRINITY_DN3619_c0_g1~~TRINITY_DN3619_c0_g1_i1.p1  ORF type:complete len:758 (-),score=197.72 TRINITY_DN3619_c0_g1_i1:38-2311(-)